MVEMIVKVVDLIILNNLEKMSAIHGIFESSEFTEARAFIVTKVAPDKNDGYHIIIFSVEILQKDGESHKVLLQGKLLNESLEEVGIFEAKVKLVNGRWEGMSLFKTKQSFRPSSMILPNDLR